MTASRLLLAMVLGACLAQAVASAEPEKRYIVHYRAGQDAAADRSLRARGGIVRQRLGRHRAAAAMLRPAQAAQLALDPAVEAVEEDAPRYPVSMMRSQPSGADLPSPEQLSTQVIPYGVRMIQARAYRGDVKAGVRTCVIDSGYDLGHEDKPGTVRVSGTSDPGAGKWFKDGDGHGSHVSGTINARNNAFGVIGALPGAPLHIVRVFGNSGLWTYSSDLVAALDRCRESGARIVNMSLGGGEPTTLERNAFAAARAAGVLSFASAGNDGNTSLLYPASYPAVISVAAVDVEMQHAPFSNRNARVALAAPGVSVLSTVPRGTVIEAQLISDFGTVAAIPMENAPVPTASVTGKLVDCGLAPTVASCGNATGAICLIERGTTTFAQKSQNCQSAGGIAAVVYNRTGENGAVFGTLGSTRVAIPVVGIDRATGIALRSEHLGSSPTLAFGNLEYDYDWYSGTSMASPHAAAAAQIIWSRHPNCSADDIQGALFQTARDLGVPGRDPDFGFGLVQTRAAATRLDDSGCNAP